MRLHRFFTQQFRKDEGELADKNLIHQIKNVLHLKAGEEIILFNGTGKEYRASIKEFGKDVLRISVIGESEPQTEPRPHLTLYQSLIKKDNFEWIVQKCTELGVSEFVPVLASRSEKKSLNYKRLKKIIQEAVEQSGRVKLPYLCETISLIDALQQAPKPALFLHPAGTLLCEILVAATFRLRNSTQAKACGYHIFIGPEGGWTEHELELAKTAGARIVSLGPRILRSETAAVAATAIILTSCHSEPRGKRGEESLKAT